MGENTTISNPSPPRQPKPARAEKASACIPEWHICGMTVLFRCRIDRKLLKRAATVTQELGTSLPEAVRIFVAQIARTGSVPISLSTESGPDVLVNESARDKIMRSLDDTETWWSLNGGPGHGGESAPPRYRDSRGRQCAQGPQGYRAVDQPKPGTPIKLVGQSETFSKPPKQGSGGRLPVLSAAPRAGCPRAIGCDPLRE